MVAIRSEQERDGGIVPRSIVLGQYECRKESAESRLVKDRGCVIFADGSTGR